MPYIGKNPVGGGFHKLDNLTASATDTYALTLGSAAYYPESANQLLVSLNGVIQAPQDSFTVSGSDLVFDTALTASDSIDFVVALGDVLAVKTVTDGAITTAKLGNSAVTDAKIDTMAASKLTGTINSARFPSGSIIQTQYTQFTSTASVSISANTDTAFTDLTVNITPTSTNSIIRLEAQVYGEFSDRIQTWDSTVFFFRDTTKLAHPAAGNRNCGVATMLLSHESDSLSTAEGSGIFQYFDSPSTTSQITYKVGMRSTVGVTFNLNRTVNDTNSTSFERFVSSIVATEIAG